VVAGAHLPIGAIDACGKRIDDNLNWSSGWIGDVPSVVELGWTSVAC
jgi:hypothetical protein